MKKKLKFPTRRTYREYEANYCCIILCILWLVTLLIECTTLWREMPSIDKIADANFLTFTTFIRPLGKNAKTFSFNFKRWKCFLKLWKSYGKVLMSLKMIQNCRKRVESILKKVRNGPKLLQMLNDIHFFYYGRKMPKVLQSKPRWCKCLTKPPLLLTENRLFCTKLFFLLASPTRSQNLGKAKKIWWTVTYFHKYLQIIWSLFLFTEVIFFQSAFHISRPYAFSIAWVVRPLICEN